MADETTAGAGEEEITVADAPQASRYEIKVGDRRAGFADYLLNADTIVFTHTEIDPAFGGLGLGGVLVGTALDGARDAGLRVSPRCPFVADYIKRHPEYEDLLA